MGLRLDDPVSAVDGVGPTHARTLASKLEVRTVRDLVTHYPRRYHDRGELTVLSEVVEDEAAILVGTIVEWSGFTSPRGRRVRVDKALVAAQGGGTFDVTYFNQPWQPRGLRPGATVAFSGKVTRFKGRVGMNGPEAILLDGTDAEGITRQRLLPVYPAAERLTSERIRGFVEAALEALPAFEDHLDTGLLDRFDLLALDDALRAIHVPPDRPTLAAARHRLVFDELLTLQLGLQWRRIQLEAELAGVASPPVEAGLASRFLAGLPYAPTGAQQHAMAEIGDDLAGERPMHRLLQGDVGAGKTLVAVWSMLCAVDNGRQAALMVPTEVLAEQHHRTLLEQLAPLGVNVLDGVRVELLTSSTSAGDKRRILSELLTGTVDLVVGTHALLEEGVRFADLGLVVIDEQHRFGVSQRVGLKDKRDPGADGRGSVPDVLVMTATPIPRSLALTMYGDLDVTVLDEMPPGREPITTQLITPREPERRDRLWAFVRSEAETGRQTYVVCPLVEETEDSPLAAAVTERERLAAGPLAGVEVELVHGRMRSDEKDAAMQRFRRGEAPVLVATTVIEVGVDVPSATIMVIEDAERFGISQLHQLRGRVGRGGGVSYCVLFAGWRAGEDLTDEARKRLEAVAATTDGFELAEVDLAIRGEGALFGTRQSGLPDLKLARLLRDQHVIAATRALARELVERDHDLTDPTHAALRAEVLRRYEGGLEAFAALETG
ncbi:MAG: ATP-dependent DNA helicase RecG [Actinomycetes bacterium]